MLRPTPSPALTAIARSALQGIEPVVVVNRRIDNAISTLDRAPDATFETIHTSDRPGFTNSSQRVIRRLIEQHRGTYGEGDLAGRTVYGSVRFVPSQDATQGATSVLDALQLQGEVGVRAYGPISLVVDPRRADARTTYSPDDTGASFARAFAEPDISAVVAERITRGAEGLPKANQLVAMPPAAAADAIRGWLLSDQLAKPGNYMEAQVRGLTPGDLLGGVAYSQGSGDAPRIHTINPGAAPKADELDALALLTDRLGIPLRRVEPS
jgi:hypothetical protein